MKMTVSGKLVYGFSFCIFIIIAILSVSFFHLRKMEKAHVASSDHSDNALAASSAASVGADLYRIIAEAILTRNMDEVGKRWVTQKSDAIETINSLAAYTDTPEEKKEAEAPGRHLANIVTTFEKELFPALSNPATSGKLIADIYTRIDADIKNLNDSIDAISESAETKKENAEASFSSTDRKIYIVSIVLAIFAIAGAILAAILTHMSIVQPILSLTQIAREMEKGDCYMEIPYHSEDEIGMLADAFRAINEEQVKIIENLKCMSRGDFTCELALRSDRDELGKALVEMSDQTHKTIELVNLLSNGDLDVEIEPRSDNDELSMALQNMLDQSIKVVSMAIGMANGDFTAKIKMRSDNDELNQTLTEMVEHMNEVMTRIRQSTKVIGDNAGHVSDASHSLAQMATESAASLEEMTIFVMQTGELARKNADIAAEANTLSGQAKNNAQKGNVEMKGMLTAMSQIRDASNRIREVVKLIDDMAFQTNLLSLNAAVEAARAGRSGRGFAVVANAVRQLAVRSGEAASETAELLSSTIASINDGQNMTNRMAESLKVVEESSVKVAELIDVISSASVEQAKGVTRVSEGLQQLNIAVQGTSTNAEKTTSASEILFNQVEELQKIISKFTLKKEGAAQ